MTLSSVGSVSRGAGAGIRHGRAVVVVLAAGN